MVGLATHMLMQLALVSTSVVPTHSYHDAYTRAHDLQQPLLVLVGSDSSAEFHIMKQTFLPELARDGSLKDVVFAVVDRDAHAELAMKLAQSNEPAQLVLYFRRDSQWMRAELESATSAAAVRGFLHQNLSPNAAVEVHFSVPIRSGSS